MYEAKDNQVMYIGEGEEAQVFLTVHETRDCTITIKEQAVIIADLLNFS